MTPGWTELPAAGRPAPTFDPMNIFLHHLRSQTRCLLTLFVLGAWLCNATALNARAQLAITEVMSDAATNCAGVFTRHPDFAGWTRDT